MTPRELRRLLARHPGGSQSVSVELLQRLLAVAEAAETVSDDGVILLSSGDTCKFCDGESDYGSKLEHQTTCVLLRLRAALARLNNGETRAARTDVDTDSPADIVRALAKLDDAALSTACWAIRKLHRRAIEWVARNPVTR